MDNSQKTPGRPSGIPRLTSRLPLPTSATNKSIRPSPSRDKLQTDLGLNASRSRRPSQEPVFKKPLPKNTLPKKPVVSQQQRRDVSQTKTSDARGLEVEGAPNNKPLHLEVDDAEARGRTRPSLSERTIETLSQIPPSPGPQGRQSNFFGATSPMRSPSRPPSAMTSYSRSPSRSSSRQPSGGDYLSRPPSAMRLPSRSGPSLSANSAAGDQSSISSTDSPSKLKKPSARITTYDRTNNLASASDPRPVPSRAYSRPAESVADAPQQRLEVKKTRKMQPRLSGQKPSLIGSRSPSAKSTTSDLTAEQQTEIETRKVSRSSSALRESIAKAKAARKAEAQKSTKATTFDRGNSFDTQDPFNQRPKDSNHGLLRKRIEAGRTSGHLNIAAMSLKELPKEVMTMYDFDPNSTTEWYESVDLVRFIAADNEFTELPNDAFPNIDAQELDPDIDERGNQFGGLELLDLHGNMLQSLPLGFRRLQRLHTLNLSNNSLTINDIRVVMDMISLRDLRLARNRLKGALTSDIARLSNLEILDLHENSLTDLPRELGELVSLRVLNVGNNELNSLPFETLHSLPLKEIHAPRNKLKDTLLPACVRKFETLQILDVASNALVRLSDHESLELPNIQTLAINTNRIQTLPDISSWQALLTLSAEDNSISDLPQGFTGLKNVRNVDFTGNDISRLDAKIGLMENLFTFRIANNPLRERRFLSMTTEDLKRDLRNRCEPEPQDTDDEGSVATQFTLAPETPAQTASWQIKAGGVVDRSYTELQELEVEELERISFHDIRCLQLQHNELRCFPVPALSMLASNLTDLDLSNNPLDGASLFSASLTLPNLQNLNLSAANLSTLQPLLSSLTAPALTFLDVSYNRLSGPLPAVRRSYPNLTTLLAADNRISNLNFDSVQGLQVLDVGNNDIGVLPPKLGLLRGEGSSKNWGNGSPLRRFEVAGNSFRVPRWQVVAKGTDAILEWLKDRIPAEELQGWESGDDSNEE
ncbi:leucine-rich repeat-containing protein 40 [Aspergillus sclerotioniger CBS 115572]|uniref:Leucine-rich repeat-containing protein 40 n=1 Tax=Aspergillus sclerotioniger CBS 115572 TaxID=1450535 RepID=A0A317V9Y8_9EURO|nr:leucine-rich repeat-containing protein 40 [Aspergillus sclerotioniger CBS 115572]PWY69837.1 leucine-rich repeat-containing protein 40 [Aspergillus sclerotioniger CBS 115572]